MFYTIILVAITVMPFATGMSGPFYLVGALALGMGFLYYAGQMLFAGRDDLAMRTFGYSIYYLMGLFSFLLVDHYWFG